MRLGRNVGPEIMRHFVATIANAEWLRVEYAQASSGALSAALFGLWCHQSQDIVGPFLTDELRQRVAQEAIRPPSSLPGENVAAISLVGVASLIGLNPPTPPDAVFELANIEALLDWINPDRPNGVFGYIQIQAWLGLRAIARVGSHSVQVPPKVGRCFLTQWKQIEGQTPQQEALNSWMIGWLERCEREEWQLVRDEDCCPACPSVKAVETGPS